MVGNWLLSAARIFTQESLLSAPLMAAVCWAANSVQLSPKPAIAKTSNTHILYHWLACFIPHFYSDWRYSLLPDFFSHALAFPQDSSEAWEHKASLTTSHYTTTKSIFRFLPVKLFIHGCSSSQLAWILFIQHKPVPQPSLSEINVFLHKELFGCRRF